VFCIFLSKIRKRTPEKVVSLQIFFLKSSAVFAGTTVTKPEMWYKQGLMDSFHF